MKLLLLVIPALLIWWILRLLRAPAPAREKRKPRVESMVACEKCGLHVPESEAIVKDGKPYCSREHADGAGS